MNDHSLRVLEFDAVRSLLAEQATSLLGRERALALTPSPDAEQVCRWQTETAEAVRLLDQTGQVPLGAIRDIRESLKIATIEGLLEPSALLAIADTAAAARGLRGYLLKHAEVAPALAELAGRISDFSGIENAVHGAITPNAEMRDDASATLQRLRREAKAVHGRIMERLQSILRSAQYREMIQEPIITLRDDRYCIPVKSEFRTPFGGLVHDQSSSGATVFMEPTAVVELGNELRQVQIRERQEVERILRELTSRVGQTAPNLWETLEALAEVDFIVARARLGHAQRASAPEVVPDGPLVLYRARHPLLKGDVVPIDVRLGEEQQLLVITGPNTGGKTVSLKTVGLIALMAQSGLQVPAESGSTVPVFAGVFADIGDEQSIQQSLSTFSGHITNIVTILQGVETGAGRSLVLLDELGAGTDPTEGAALAKSILAHLQERGVLCIATTHYGELKEFAYTRTGVENASVEFDLQTLRPTYRLLTGIPGSSNAFTIAARLGMPAAIAQAARSFVGTDQAQLTDVIERLTRDQRATEEHQLRASRAAEEVEALRARYERDLRQLHADREETLRRARADADRTLRAARQQAERLQDELRGIEKAARDAGGSAAVARLREQARGAVRQAERGALPGVPEPEPEVALPPPERVRLDKAPPRPGDEVWVAALNQKGVLIEEPAGDRAQVQFGTMRMSLPYGSLQRIASLPAKARERTAASPTSTGDMRLKARASISPEVHLRGQHVEEALRVLEEYMDSAILAGLSPVRVVHGKGTGVLKRVVWDWLRGHPYVEDFRLGETGEGGGGVTVVRLKE